MSGLLTDVASQCYYPEASSTQPCNTDGLQRLPPHRFLLPRLLKLHILPSLYLVVPPQVSLKQYVRHGSGLESAFY